jgi:hypothetical protein
MFFLVGLFDILMEIVKYNFKEVMNCHYRVDIFESELANETFLEPELLPFD